MVGAAGSEGNCAASTRFLIGLCAVGALWRGFVSWLTPLPSEDGANYLWMAERFAEGNAAEALSDVFPPLTSLLTAIPIAIGLDPFRAGQVALALAGALSLVLLVRGAEAVVPGTGRCAGCFAVFAPLPVRFGAEIYSEPLFILVTAWGVVEALRGRWAWAGLAAGIAFWVRPEAAVLAAGLVLARPRAVLRIAAPFAACAAVLALWRGLSGHGYGPVAKSELIAERSVFAAGDVGSAVVSFGSHLVQLPWLWIEAFGLLGLLAVWGLVRGPRRPAVLLWTLGLAAIVICLFLPRRRFLVGWLAVMAPLALVGFAALPLRVRQVTFWLVIASSIVLSLRTMDDNRRAERLVGEYLRAQLQPGETVAGDMTRVIYYAGERPLVPRPFTVDELVQRFGEKGVRFAVLGSKRDSTPEILRRVEGDYTRLVLPEEMREVAGDRGIVVLERR